MLSLIRKVNPDFVFHCYCIEQRFNLFEQEQLVIVVKKQLYCLTKRVTVIALVKQEKLSITA